MSTASVKIYTGGTILSNDIMKQDRDDDIFWAKKPRTRREARESALQALYALELSGNTLETVLDQLFDSALKESAVCIFTQEMICKTYDARDRLDKYIRRRSTNWDFSRIAVIDKIILRMAICEFLFFEDVPPKVSIDEAIELSKRYSTEKSSRFINGILDAVLAELEKKTTRKIKKPKRE